jgi:hypothetical protein
MYLSSQPSESFSIVPDFYIVETMGQHWKVLVDSLDHEDQRISDCHSSVLVQNVLKEQGANPDPYAFVEA